MVRIEESKDVFTKIQSILGHRAFDLDDRKTVAVACLASSIEYHASLHLLFSNKCFSSATALLRSQFESYVKGTWFLHCSQDNHVTQAYNDKFDREFHRLVGALKHNTVPGWEDIEYIKENLWVTLNGFTHTGRPQLARRFNGDNISPNYNETLIKSALDLGDFIAFRAMLELIDQSTGELSEEVITDLISSTEFLRSSLSNL